MTELMRDILAEPGELSRILAHTYGPGRAALERAADAVNAADHVYITGIGSSWHAGMAIRSFFDSAARPVQLVESSEFVYFVEVPPKSAVITLSRSGRSVEIVRSLDKCRQAGASVIGITNTPESPLGTRSDVTLCLNARFDHMVSVTMYSGVVLVGGLLAAAAVKALDESTIGAIADALTATEAAIGRWVGAIDVSEWFAPGMRTYLLARGAGLAACHESRLLWEEATKSPATALPTGGFRHGPQEVIEDGLRIGLWIDAEKMRDADLALAVDARGRGAKVCLIGQNVPRDAADLVLNLPAIPPRWQFVIEIIPAQITGEHFSRVKGVDCDAFRLCPYIVESEGGLMP